MFPEAGQLKMFLSPPARIVKCVSKDIFFNSKMFNSKKKRERETETETETKSTRNQKSKGNI